MRFEIGSVTAAAALARPRVQVQLNYASRARAEEHSRRRREAVWAGLSLVALLLCWDFSARLDQRVLGEECVTASAATTLPVCKPGFPRRLRKFSEEVEDEAPRSFDSTK